MIQTNENIFIKEGTIIEITGNKPLLLDDNESVWFVHSGKVDVFLVRVKNGEPVGARSHLFRAVTGQALFGIDSESYGKGIGLLASGITGTQLLRLKKSQLKELAKNTTYVEKVIALIDSWVVGFSSSVYENMLPKKYEQLEAGKKVVLEENISARPKEGIVWVKHLEGDSQFMGKKDLSLITVDNFFPLTDHSWLQSVNENKLYVIDTKSFINEDPSWVSLEQFHQLVLDCIILNKKQEEEAERERLRIKSENDKRDLKNAFSRLASILEIKEKKVIIEEMEEPLLTACQLVGKALAITIKPHPGSKRGQEQRDPLDNIAKASRIRIRQVALRGNWWRSDSGPLLAFIQENKRPVALLPTSATSYELHDPVERTKTTVTRKIASSLEPFAYTFYRPFPECILTGSDLLKFALHGLAKDLIMVVFMGIIAGILGLFTPIATGIIFDTIIPEAETNQLLQLTLVLIVCAFGIAIFQFTQAIAMLRIEGRTDTSFQSAVWDRLLNLPVPFFRNYTAGDLANRAMGIDTIRQILSGITIQAIISFIFSIFNFGLLFYYSWKLALAATGLIIFTLIFTTISTYLQIRHQKTLVNIQGRISGMVLQFITGISKIRVAGAEGRIINLWSKEFNTQKKIRFKVESITNYVTVFNSVFPVISSIIIFLTIVYLNKKALEAGNMPMSTGTFLAFNFAFVNFLNAMLTMTQAAISALAIVPSYERAKPIFQMAPEVDEAKSDPDELTGEIEVSYVNFSYTEDGPPILKDVSVHIDPGEFVAIVGPSGSGKSTLFRILLGFEIPSSGTVYYDGQDLAGLDIRSVRRQLGVVLQNSRVMGGDIFCNIVGSSRLTMDDAWEAARAAGFDEDIKQMPMGMHTFLSPGATTLSGGQRQRLMIARAIAHKPRILFFDEATSALDNRTQAIVSESLGNLQSTRVVIAHRLSTIMNADRIYVLEAGKVVQGGTYDELISREGPFAELAKRQLA